MPPELIDQIRQALAVHVKRRGESYYAIARACKLDVANMYRFRDGKGGLSEPNLNRLAKYLGLTVVVSRPR